MCANMTHIKVMARRGLIIKQKYWVVSKLYIVHGQEGCLRNCFLFYERNRLQNEFTAFLCSQTDVFIYLMLFMTYSVASINLTQYI